MKSRNHLHADIRNLKLSRNNWRRKYELLQAENKRLKEEIKYMTKPYSDSEITQLLLKETSKQLGWQAWRDKYG